MKEKKNRRYGMKLLSLWISKSEELSLIESIKILNKEATSKENGYAVSNISEIIHNAYNRGDLK